MKHPTTELIAYMTGGLSPEERAGLETHLAACADCRRERDGFAAVLAGLRGSLPTAPEPRWGQWRAELRERLGTGAIVAARAEGRAWRINRTIDTILETLAQVE